MLQEVKATRQIPGEPFRRWYTDNDTDLIVWLEQYKVVGFQLTVPAALMPAVLTWHEGKSPHVAGLDDGEGCPARPKMTPVLIECRDFDPAGMLCHFKSVSAELPSGLAKLIEQRIGEMHNQKGPLNEPDKSSVRAGARP